MEKFKDHWEIKQNWQLLFPLLGTLILAKPIIKFIGITKENLNPFAYWVLYIIIGFIFYQILLVLIGWLFGQFKFFWNFEKKMIRRFGLKKFVD